MQLLKSTLALALVLMFALADLAWAGPADPLAQADLTNMTAIQLQSEFDATIQMARQAQADFHKSRGRRLATSLIPLVGIVGAGETASRAGNLQAYQCKLLQLKRELRSRFPQAWEDTKKKWCIDDNYLER